MCGLKFNVDIIKFSCGGDILCYVIGVKIKEEVSIVFSCFFFYLSYVEYFGL